MKEFRVLFSELYTPDLEPPHTFLLTARFVNEKERLKVKLEQKYYGREDFSEEELQEEGYTGRDDFSWEGGLPENWRKELALTASSTRLSGEEEDVYLEIDKETGFPEKPGVWRYLLQELLQAAFEHAGKEASFIAGLADGTKTILITASFYQRTITVDENENGKKKQKEADWSNLKPLLARLQALDLDPESGTSQPGKEGIFLNPGDALWYKLPEALRKQERDQKKADNLVSFLKEL